MTEEMVETAATVMMMLGLSGGHFEALRDVDEEWFRGAARAALEAARQADPLVKENTKLREALMRIRDRDWEPVALMDGGEVVATISAPDFEIARAIAADAVATGGTP